MKGKQLDWILSRAGFVKAHQLPLDSVWVARRALADGRVTLPRRFWYPPSAERDWAHWTAFRNSTQGRRIAKKGRDWADGGRVNLA